MPIRKMTPRVRKVALSTHVSVSVGWLGAVAAYLALAITGIATRDSGMASTVHRSMEVIGWLIVVPCGLAASMTGWYSHWVPNGDCSDTTWIVAKLSLTVSASVILLLHIPSVSRMARIAVDTTLTAEDFTELRVQLLVHAVGGLLVLLTITALSVYTMG